MYGYVVKLLIRRTLRRHQSGDVEALLRSYADDARFVFPGNNSWAGEFRGKEAIASWLRRFHEAGLKVQPHEIVVGGPPWNTTVCVRITDRATDAGGNVIYENRAVLFGKIRWGKITFYEVYEDTEKVAVLDAYLADRQLGGTA